MATVVLVEVVSVAIVVLLVHKASAELQAIQVSVDGQVSVEDQVLQDIVELADGLVLVAQLV